MQGPLGHDGGATPPVDHRDGSAERAREQVRQLGRERAAEQVAEPVRDDAPPPIRVIVGDRSLLLRNLLRRIAPGQGVRVVGETASGAELVEMARALRPDVVLSDVELEDGTLEMFLPALAGRPAPPAGPEGRDPQSAPRYEPSKVLALCDVCAPDRLVAVLVGGASGYLLHDASPQQLLDGIHAVAAGAAAFDPKVAGTILAQWRTLRAGGTGLPRSRRPLLTPREEDVLRAMVEGLPAKAIARRLGVATKTVENHKIRIFDKLGVRTQAQAVSLAIGQGLLTADPGRPVEPAVAGGV